jgi:hypothetical protein
MFRFLEVDDVFIPDRSIRYSAYVGIPHHRTWHKWVFKSNPLLALIKPLLSPQFRWRIREKFKMVNARPKPPLLPEVRRELIEVYRDDILQLQALLHRDLTGWLDPC